jgi:hypothetical protein
VAAPAHHLHAQPAGFAITGAKADERQVLLDILDDAVLLAGRAGQIILETRTTATISKPPWPEPGSSCRPARQGAPQRPGGQFFRPLRQIIESVSDTFKGQLDLERHGGHTPGTTTAPASRSCAS